MQPTEKEALLAAVQRACPNDYIIGSSVIIEFSWKVKIY